MPNTNTSMLFSQKEMFTKSSICKFYTVTSNEMSGETNHYHDYMQIWYIAKGSCEHFIEQRRHVMVKGDMFILPPGIEHQIVKVDNVEIICCEFNFDLFFPEDNYIDSHTMREVALGLSFDWLFLKDSPDLRSRFSLSSETSSKIHNLFIQMITEYNQSGLFYEECLKLQIAQLLILVSRERATISNGESSHVTYEKYIPAIELSINYIKESYAEKIQLETLCKISMLSKTYFCFLFKEITKKTFVEYITDLRVEKAMELLRESDKSITLIGFETGFNDPTHFSRTFKKNVGISPRLFRTST